MTSFEIVAIVLCLFLGLGVAMGVLIVLVFSRRRPYQYLEDDPRWLPAPREDGERRSWPGG